MDRPLDTCNRSFSAGRRHGFSSQLGSWPLSFLSVGIVVSQPILIAMWIALAPQRFYVRFLWGLLVFALTFFAVGCGLSLNETRANAPAAAVFIAAGDLLILVAASLMLLLVRRVTRWQIVHRDGKQRGSEYQAYQFGIKHLMILTAIVAFALGLFRTLVLMESRRPAFPGISQVTDPIRHISVMLFPLIIVPWSALAYVRNVAWSIMRAVFFIGIIDVAAFFIFRWAGRGLGIIEIHLLFQCGAGLSMFATAFVLRLCGFRMARVPASGAHIDA